MELKHGLDSNTDTCACAFGPSKSHVWSRASHSSLPHTGAQSLGKKTSTFLCASGRLTRQRLSLSTFIICLLTVLYQGSAVNETVVFNIIFHTSPCPDAQRSHVCLPDQVFTRLLLTGMVHTKDLTVVFVPWAWTKNFYNGRYNIQKMIFGLLKPWVYHLQSW